MNTTTQSKPGAKPGRKRRPGVLGQRQTVARSYSLPTSILEDVDVIRESTGWTTSRTIGTMLEVFLLQDDGDLSAIIDRLTATTTAE